ncbi:uncharacterized protein [Diabrotica undecimpunctata]|uniref:uncharacterized protein isoform X2 n=1 Tax=Diabrotica undecimpunctata TaxID=50387 RepID=UPI003B636907
MADLFKNEPEAFQSSEGEDVKSKYHHSNQIQTEECNNDLKFESNEIDFKYQILHTEDVEFKPNVIYDTPKDERNEKGVHTLVVKDSMVSDMLGDREEKPFQCTICLKQFRQKQHLDRHILTLHKGDFSRRLLQIKKKGPAKLLHRKEKKAKCSFKNTKFYGD